MSSTPQAGILSPLPPAARYLSLRLRQGVAAEAIRSLLARLPAGPQLVCGLGASLVRACGAEVEGLRDPVAASGPGVSSPSTPRDLWLWLRGADPSEVFLLERELRTLLAPAFSIEEAASAFHHAGGRDLSGYEDGTENPTGAAASAAALVSTGGPGLDGSSFVSVQRWVHDFDRLDAMSQTARDHVIGRRLEDNEELDDAPASAHVKRTAQEDFDPPAFVLRRSMPYVDGADAGLMFVAFGCSLNAFEAQLHRMLGLDDGVVDALFTFTTPVTTGNYWCPPVADGGLDLRALSAPN